MGSFMIRSYSKNDSIKSCCQHGEILYGGNPLMVKVFVQPTIIKAKNDYQIVKEETFNSL